MRSCIKVAADFVAPEHVGHCVRLTEELRQLPTWHHRRQDVLSVRTILLHATLACFAAFDESRKKEDARRERQRRLERKTTLSNEPPPNALTSAATPAVPTLFPPASGDTGELSAVPTLSGQDSVAIGEEVAAALLL